MALDGMAGWGYLGWYEWFTKDSAINRFHKHFIINCGRFLYVHFRGSIYDFEKENQVFRYNGQPE